MWGPLLSGPQLAVAGPGVKAPGLTAEQAGRGVPDASLPGRGVPGLPSQHPAGLPENQALNKLSVEANVPDSLPHTWVRSIHFTGLGKLRALESAQGFGLHSDLYQLCDLAHAPGPLRDSVSPSE